MTEGFIDIHTHHPNPSVRSPKMAGIHPWDADKNLPLPDFSGCDIIGETGLDYASAVSKTAQESLFRAHLEEAEILHKPVVLHVVRAFEPVMKILSGYRGISAVVFHGFVGSVQQAQRCYDAGYYLSFGERTLRSAKSRAVIAGAPAHLIFCETDDNPDLSIADIYREVSAIRGISVDDLKEQIATNYKILMQNDTLA